MQKPRTIDDRHVGGLDSFDEDQQRTVKCTTCGRPCVKDPFFGFWVCPFFGSIECKSPAP